LNSLKYNSRSSFLYTAFLSAAKVFARIVLLLVSQGVISRNYDDSQYNGLILDFD
jgi:hypothetical protein